MNQLSNPVLQNKFWRDSRMGWLQRLFGMEKPQNPEQAVSGQASPEAVASAPAEAQVNGTIPPERVGLNLSLIHI